MLMLRVITACVLLAILLLAIWIGPLAFAGVMAIAFGAVLFEWLRMTGLGPVPAIVVASVEMITQFSLYWAGALPRMSWFLFLVNGAVMIAWFVIFFAELFHRDTGFHVTVRQSLIAAVVFVPSAYLSLLWLYEAGDWVLVLSVLLIVWGADISAYFCGRAWGKHKLCRAISPNKTWEALPSLTPCTNWLMASGWSPAGSKGLSRANFSFIRLRLIYILFRAAGVRPAFFR